MSSNVCVSRLVRSSVPVLAAAFVIGMGLAVAYGAHAESDDDTDHAGHDHRFIRITATKVHPKSQTISSDQALGWINYSPQVARITFDREVAKHLTCTTKGSFRLTGERFESSPIQGRQFASLCKLDPGEYDYEVELFRGAGASDAGVTSRTLPGHIVVTE